MWLHPCVWVEASKTWHWLLICPTSIVVPLNPLYVHLLPVRMLILLAGPQPCHQLRRLRRGCCLILCLLISNNHDVFHIHDIHIQVRWGYMLSNYCILLTKKVCVLVSSIYQSARLWCEGLIGDISAAQR